uniref:Uncharacterized protein n=1 Tax=Solanum lycopersicum TaxID=4081 RepID=A0A3Q7I1N6_SOLLC
MKAKPSSRIACRATASPLSNVVSYASHLTPTSPSPFARTTASLLVLAGMDGRHVKQKRRPFDPVRRSPLTF